ncbi:hypothetical protein LQZ24_03540 [Fructobacillus sp. M1-13]|uniref:DUF4352 domain-containing protein n=1 Tax=Fructobacillus papyriferae TaxID=2713171 RepID=A0ABS5QPY3_9LACO|nr:hypothetical protein [Fructobacillus papyriferae]MBS9335230.1 hypothetical protein [Fructobacillus papyriferae]MCD2159101.1 hypothetical protein [Fructobacillus papyriferae]
MKRKQIIWSAVVILLTALTVTVVLLQQAQARSKERAAARSKSVKLRKTVEPMLNMKSGDTKTVNGLKIHVKSLKKTDYKAFNTRSVVKLQLEMKNTTDSKLYVVAAAPHGAFDVGFANSENWNLTGMATDSISAKYWTSSVSMYANDKGNLKDSNLISDRLKKKGGVTLGVGANYKYLCWTLKPGETISGNAYGIYDENQDNPDELPVLKINTDQIGVSKKTVDLYKDEYKRQVKEGTEREKALKEQQEAEEKEAQQATEDPEE